MPNYYQSDTNLPSETEVEEESFPQFLEGFKASMERAFHGVDSIEQFSSKRGFPPGVLTELMSGNPLALCIPKHYGGFGGGVKENIAFLSAASYESLALSLTLGINNALFIQPVAKYGHESAKHKFFDQFLNTSCMGGLMITEPDFGSDALSMRTSFTENNGYYHIKGKKHWAGLTGLADFWLLTARKRSESGSLQHDIDMFICDVNQSGQQIVVEEYFENLGLYQIPYGRNQIDVYIPEEQKLIPHSTGIQMLLDLLHRSRYQFPGMGLGFIKRILDEAIIHAKSRQVGNKRLFGYDQVQHRLSRLQVNYTICSSFCVRSAEVADPDKDLSLLGLEANVIKSVTSDMMHESAQSLLQLVGAKGYKLNDFAGRAMVDSRPFQIFEGSNDILYHQITESVFKMMKIAREKCLYQFLKGFTVRAADRIRELVNFDVDAEFSQRKRVEFGQVISRIVSMDLVLFLEDKGFRKDLIENAIIVLKQEIATLLRTFHLGNNTQVIVDYQENSQWFDFAV
jgi:alkylation response protein AidB-like acyl-CoA dehydrogenase